MHYLDQFILVQTILHLNISLDWVQRGHRSHSLEVVFVAIVILNYFTASLGHFRF